MCEKHFGSTFGPRLVRGFNKEILFAVENSESEEGEGITNLRNVIKTDASTNFPFVNEKFPLQWFHCEEEIIKYRQNPNSNMCITLVEFKKLLEERCLVTFTDDEFNSMISFFHDTGLILLPGMLISTLFLGFTMQICSKSEWGSTSTLLMFILYWREQMIRNCTYLLRNTRPTHTVNI